ncbi:MarR family winged helix-turn-helix transcriptional regulator [Microbacterium sp. YJN-G]|uniref:MarR family winged helix-turn-helix transcriptional regulator n=1 Tax=Microbacterium sp. YJN-G TaxID=2763257 RepID=UPI001878881F|nr:MarR family transcriptional regulator [Microbacterium sp. YJN-G]
MANEDRPAQSRVVLHDPARNDPDEQLVRRSHLSPSTLADVLRVLDGMRRWREAERRMSEASQRYMKLGETDMRALRLLIAAQRQGVVVTPGSIAEHLAISTASTTKLLDRLERGGHIRRLPHPTDRRSLTIEITDDTRVAARETVGRAHARRFDVVAALSPEERAVVADFFDALEATAVTSYDDAIRAEPV